MASIVSAGTTSATALNMSADTSGVLQLASNNGTVALTVSTDQIVGLGSTTYAWGSSNKAIDMSLGGFGYIASVGSPVMTQNCYHNGSNLIYKTTGIAGYIQLYNGTLTYYAMPSGTGGTSGSPVNRLSLDYLGSLAHVSDYNTQSGSIYTRNTNTGSSAQSGMTVGNDISANVSGFVLGSSTTVGGKQGASGTYIYNNSGTMRIYTETTKSMYFGVSNADLFQLNANGTTPTNPINVTPDSGWVSIGVTNSALMYIGTSQIRIIPRYVSTAVSDNVIDLGDAGSRFRVIYAGTGSINTSDANEKQDIKNLSDAEKRVATKIKLLFKTFRFKDAVAQKGDDARIHSGVIAQDLFEAFSSEGLDAHRYALFCSDIWYTVDGKDLKENGERYSADDEGAVKNTRLGVRYSELLSFVISAL